MNKSCIIAILAVTSLSFSAGAMAQDMSNSEYKAAEKNILAEHKSAKINCASFAGNTRDICMAEAKGKRNVATTELKTRYKPSRKSDYQISVAKAQADFAVAREKCDDRAGKVRAACVKEAKTVLARAKSDAKAQLLLLLSHDIKALEAAKLVAKAQSKSSGASTTSGEQSSAAPQGAEGKK